jgi:alkylation response protein AidB-like acyl-CoA dehydrogenase
VTAPHLELRALLTGEIMPRHVERWGESTDWEALVDFQKQLSTHGWTAPSWPVDGGGRGLGVEEQLACDVELRRADAPRRVAVYGVNNVGPTILAHGTAEQQSHARAIVDATEFWCQGFSEPDYGSDLAGLKCRAEADGDDFVINGSKVWTSIGLWATHCMLLVRTDPEAAKHRGISALLIPLDLEGVERSPIKQIDGRAEFAELHFSDVRVPQTTLLGPINEGWRITMATLGFERAGTLSLAGSMAEEAESAIRGAAERMALDPALREDAMHLWSDTRILGWMGERALAEAGEEGAPEITGSVIKLAFSLTSLALAEFGADAAGATAMLEGPESQRLLGSRSSSIAGGTTEVMKNILGERALGLPREPRS